MSNNDRKYSKESTKQECVLWAREQRNNSKVKTIGELLDSPMPHFFFLLLLLLLDAMKRFSGCRGRDMMEFIRCDVQKKKKDDPSPPPWLLKFFLFFALGSYDSSGLELVHITRVVESEQEGKILDNKWRHQF